MKALLILAAGGVLAWLYGRWLNRQTGEALMTFGVLAYAPWAVIAAGTVAALVVWS